MRSTLHLRALSGQYKSRVITGRTSTTAATTATTTIRRSLTTVWVWHVHVIRNVMLSGKIQAMETNIDKTATQITEVRGLKC